MRALADSLRNKWKTAVVVLASAEDGGVAIVAAVTKDLTAKVHAGKLVGAVAQAIGGKGGGRPDMAEGGGKDAAALDGALEDVSPRSREQAVSAGICSMLGGGRGPHRPGLRHRAEERGVKAVLIEKGCVVNSHLPLPHQHDVLHHAGTAGNRRYPHDQPQRKAQPHRGAQILPPRGRSLQARHPPVRARGPHRRRRQRFQRVHHRPAGLPARLSTRRKIVLATGYYDVPNLLNVPGEDLDKVLHYYKEPHPYYNHDVAVIGRQELRRHRRLGTVVDRRARHPHSSRRGNLRQRQILDQTQHREPHQERGDPGLLSLAAWWKFCRIPSAWQRPKAKFP